MPTASTQSKEILTLQELCDSHIIPVGKRTIVKFLKTGELPGGNFRPENGRLNLWRIRRSDAEDFVKERFGRGIETAQDS